MSIFDAIQRVAHMVRTLVAWWQKPENQRSADIPVGKRGERIAAEFLKKLGYRILFQGYRSSLGEIDIIALDKSKRQQSTVVFVEVKSWAKPFSEGGPSDAVDQRKQQKLTQLALEFLKTHGLMECQARFDVIEVILNPQAIRHFVNAFEATGRYQWFS